MPRPTSIRRAAAAPKRGVQRGSVADMPTYPGDPLTPGVGATPDAKRLTRAQAITILKIPTLPISYGDATKILAALAGPVVTGSERGGLAAHLSLGRDRRGQGPPRGQVRLVAEAASTT